MMGMIVLRHRLLRHPVQLCGNGPRWTVGRRLVGPLLGLGSQGERRPLIIVLWNALVLHARWGDLVEGPRTRDPCHRRQHRHLLVLVFGVNQLGIGLHSYGFNKELVQILCGVVMVHLLFIIFGGLGLLLTKWGWS